MTDSVSRSRPGARSRPARLEHRFVNGDDFGALRAFRAIGRGLLAPPRAVSGLFPLAWAVSIFVLSSDTQDVGVLFSESVDAFIGNLVHPFAFGVLALLLVPLFPRGRGPLGKAWTAMGSVGALWAVTLVALYGFTDELHQSTVPGRDASLFDLLSDGVGAASVVAVVLYLGRESATKIGLRVRLGAAFLASCAAAGVATAWDLSVGEGPWPF